MPTATYFQEPAPGTRVAGSLPLQNSTGGTEPAGGGEITGRVKVKEETAEPGRRRRENRARPREGQGQGHGEGPGQEQRQEQEQVSPCWLFQVLFNSQQLKFQGVEGII